MKYIQFLKRTNLVFTIAITLGFLFPSFANDVKVLLVPSLMTMMSFSLINFKFRELQLKNVKNAIYLNLLNYIVITGLYILAAILVIKNPLYQKAMIVAGIMPPAVGIISLIYILKGDINTGFIAEIMGYAISLFAIPLLSVLFFKESVTIKKILNIIVMVIVIPFFISRILVYINSKKNVIPEDFSEIVVNVCYGLLFYITVGVNIDVFMHNFLDLIDLIAIFIFLRFGLCLILYLFFTNRVERSQKILYILFGTFKNGSAGMAITVMLFGIKATVPYAIFSIIASLYIVFLKWFFTKKR